MISDIMDKCVESRRYIFNPSKHISYFAHQKVALENSPAVR